MKSRRFLSVWWVIRFPPHSAVFSFELEIDQCVEILGMVPENKLISGSFLPLCVCVCLRHFFVLFVINMESISLHLYNNALSFSPVCHPDSLLSQSRKCFTPCNTVGRYRFLIRPHFLLLLLAI
jgi:hypothetical protein